MLAKIKDIRITYLIIFQISCLFSLHSVIYSAVGCEEKSRLRSTSPRKTIGFQSPSIIFYSSVPWAKPWCCRSFLHLPLL